MRARCSRVRISRSYFELADSEWTHSLSLYLSVSTRPPISLPVSLTPPLSVSPPVCLIPPFFLFPCRFSLTACLTSPARLYASLPVSQSTSVCSPLVRPQPDYLSTCLPLSLLLLPRSRRPSLYLSVCSALLHVNSLLQSSTQAHKQHGDLRDDRHNNDGDQYDDTDDITTLITMNNDNKAS